MPGGRPTNYSSEMVDLAAKYLKGCKDSYKLVSGTQTTDERIEEKDGEKVTTVRTSSRKARELHVKLPSIEGLALYLHIRRSTVYDWQKAHSEFSDIVEEILTTQAERLLNGGASGRYNHSISKLILTKHGYVDKVETREVEDWDDLVNKADETNADSGTSQEGN
ncbi:terminase small subunit [Streptomyces sp. NPDC058469]|uniref:terminase small subunit n=1 Tax=Streptomyces sp. NPDC058469 TaxID=3346514 RepID=UPI00364C6352